MNRNSRRGWSNSSETRGWKGKCHFRVNCRNGNPLKMGTRYTHTHTTRWSFCFGVGAGSGREARRSPVKKRKKGSREGIISRHSWPTVTSFSFFSAAEPSFFWKALLQTQFHRLPLLSFKKSRIGPNENKKTGERERGPRFQMGAQHTTYIHLHT